MSLLGREGRVGEKEEEELGKRGKTGGTPGFGGAIITPPSRQPAETDMQSLGSHSSFTALPPPLTFPDLNASWIVPFPARCPLAALASSAVFVCPFLFFSYVPKLPRSGTRRNGFSSVPCALLGVLAARRLGFSLFIAARIFPLRLQVMALLHRWRLVKKRR